jgi:Flp pilus assembly protein TadG
MMLMVAKNSKTTWRVGEAIVCSSEGSQLLEFALSVPLLLVLIIAVMDFGGAYNIKQELNNAAREGARYAANQSSNICDIDNCNGQNSPSNESQLGNVVENYLKNAGLNACTFTGASSEASGVTTYTYTASPAGCGLVVNRAYNATGSTTVISTHVTLSYPYSWTLTKLIKLLVPSSSLGLPTTISSDAIMPNIN